MIMSNADQAPVPVPQCLASARAAYSDAETAFEKGAEEKRLNELVAEHCRRFEHLLASPCQTLDEVQAKARYILDEVDDGPDWLCSDEDLTASFVRSLLGPTHPPSSEAVKTPFLQAFDQFQSDIDAFNARPEDGDLDHIEEPFFEKVGRPPRMDTHADAAAALRHVLGDNCIVDTFDEALVQGVLGYLERLGGTA